MSNARRNPERQDKEPRQPQRWRTYVVLAVFVVFAVVLGGRAFYLQVLHDQFLIHQGDMRFVRSIKVPALRGAIVDRNGNPLAISAPVKTIWAVPGQVLDHPDKIAPLADALGTSAEALKDKLEKYSERDFLYLARKLSPAHARKVKAVHAPGVFQQRAYKRYYPAGQPRRSLLGLLILTVKASSVWSCIRTSSSMANPAAGASSKAGSGGSWKTWANSNHRSPATGCG